MAFSYNFPVGLRLLLVRHGLSSFNLEGKIQGRNDLSFLTDQGEQQANHLGAALAEIPIDAIYSSPLKRARSTTNFIISKLKNRPNPIFSDLLLEVDLGSWSGLTIKELKRNFPNEFLTWKKSPKDLILTRETGEQYKPIEDLMNQAKTFINELIEKHSIKKNKTILIVAHNAILRSLILSLINEPNQGFRRLRLDNSSLSIFNLTYSSKESYQVQIECLNSTTHLNPSIPKKKSKARVILVRHGETNWNLEGRFQGQIDIPLNENGEAQAKAAGSFLRDLKIDKAYTSSLSRPKQTAEKILSSHPPIKLQEENELIEIGHGLWEGKLESEIEENWGELLNKWKTTPEKVQMPEGESIEDVWQRSVNCWNNICSKLEANETSLIVAHDAVNKTILCNLLGLTPANIWMVKQGNGGINIIDIYNDPNQPDVVCCLNLTSHLGSLLDKTAAGAL